MRPKCVLTALLLHLVNEDPSAQMNHASDSKKISANGDLRDSESHFAFGENWESYSSLIDPERIATAVSALDRLVGADLIRGRRFLDIGSGSGLHSLAALELGAGEVLAVDIDEDSVGTTRAVLNKYAPGKRYRVEKDSIFIMLPEKFGYFDVVYSWGVLHHTGDMFEALRRAALLVTKGGVFAFALYRKTRFCWFWKIEKRIYSRMAPGFQKLVRGLYVTLYRLAFVRALGGRAKFESFLDTYRTRGMDYYHDVHDWLGGYPYESISPAEVETLMTKLGFTEVRRFVHETKGRSALFGSGCDEYVYQRGSSSA
jgi:SAM-dependent methyltransferase